MSQPSARFLGEQLYFTKAHSRKHPGLDSLSIIDKTKFDWRQQRSARNRQRTQVNGDTAHSSIEQFHLLPLFIQTQDDTLHRVEQGSASTLHHPRPRPRPRPRPHRRPYTYPHPRPHPSLNLTAPPPPSFLPTSTAALLTHLCTIEQTPERRPHTYPAQRVARPRVTGRHKASLSGARRLWLAPSCAGRPRATVKAAIARAAPHSAPTRPLV